MAVTKVATFRLAGYLFSSNGAYSEVFCDPASTPVAPTVNPLTGGSETPTLVWDNTTTVTTSSTSNLPSPSSKASEV